MNIYKFNISHRTFLSILLAVAISVISVTLVLSILLYISFENISLGFINTSNLKLLSKTSSSMNYINESATNFGMSIMENIDCKNLLYRKSAPESDEDVLSVANSLARLGNLVRSVSYVHSVYLYNSSLNCYYSTNLIAYNPGDEFFDKEVDHLISTSDKNTIRLLPRKIPISLSARNKHYDNVYTYVFSDSAPAGNTRNDTVIVNLKSSWFTSEINSSYELNKLYDGSVSKVFIIDSKGIIVNHPDADMFLTDISAEPYIEKVASSKSELGYFIHNINNTKSIISYITYNNILKWKFISITPYEAISGEMAVIKRITAITCIVILILGIIVSFFLSKKVYSPINNLVTNIKNLMNTSNTERKLSDEMGFISEAFSDTMAKSHSLENFKRTNFMLLRQEMIKDIVLNPTKTPKEIELKFKEFNINLNPGQDMFLVLLKVDNYIKFTGAFNEKDQNILRFAIRNISDELLSSKFSCETADMGSDHIIALAGLTEENSNPCELLKQLIDITRQIQGSYKKYFDLSLSCSISRLSKGIAGINTIYNETLNNSNYRLVYGYGCIITHEDTTSHLKSEYLYPVEKQAQLINELKLGKISEVDQIYNDIITTIKSFSYSNIVLSYTYLASNIFSALNLIESNSTVKFGCDYYTFNKDIIHLETMDEINKKFHELFSHIGSKTKQLKTDKADLIVESIMDTIKRNYQDPNLSLDAIADIFKMSSVYIGKIFRDSTSCSVSDYINSVRLDRVMELLIKTSYNIEEIAEKVGITNSKYLFKIFKKTLGVTPGDFRLKNVVKNENYINI